MRKAVALLSMLGLVILAITKARRFRQRCGCNEMCSCRSAESCTCRELESATLASG